MNTKTNESHILLVGNGINTEKRLEWKNLLESVKNTCAKGKIKSMDAGDSKINPLILYDCFASASPTSAAKSALKFSKENSMADKVLIKKLWDNYDIILTTNFDGTLNISKKDLYTNLAIKRKSNLSRRLEFQYKKRKKKLYYIHGTYESNSSICLGLEQYVDALVSIYSQIKGKSYKSASVKRWIDFFFSPDTTIDILGFGLSDSEIDLWWILEQRFHLMKNGKIKNNRIRFFDLDEHLKNQENVKTLLLKQFGVEVPNNYVSVDVNDKEKYKKFYESVINKISGERIK